MTQESGGFLHRARAQQRWDFAAHVLLLSVLTVLRQEKGEWAKEEPPGATRTPENTASMPKF